MSQQLGYKCRCLNTCIHYFHTPLLPRPLPVEAEYQHSHYISRN